MRLQRLHTNMAAAAAVVVLLPRYQQQQHDTKCRQCCRAVSLACLFCCLFVIMQTLPGYSTKGRCQARAEAAGGNVCQLGDV
jgi:hypothetical protein